jgi:NitT/TauT family transport system ATP-binding protein
VFGMTYPFSSHNYEFRLWMAAGGIHPDRDVVMTVVPPPLTADAIAAGAIDGFCVNAPWNMIAVARGVGRVVAVKADLWPAAPEKVLGVRPGWAEQNPETLARLIVALDAAARWCDEPGNRAELATMLAAPAYVGAPEDIVRALLTDIFLVDPDGRTRRIPNYLTFYREAANFPWVSDALWLYAQMARWGQARCDEEGAARAASAYRPDIYRNALASSGTPIPTVVAKPAGSAAPVSIAATHGTITVPPDPFIDGRVFDANRIADYLAGFDIATPLQARAGFDVP